MDEIKDTNNPIQNVFDGSSIRTNPFGLNKAGERLYRRSERISAALFLITNHVPDSEPLRSLLRSEASNMLTDVLSIRGDMRAEQSKGVQRLLARTRYLISLVRLSTIAGYLSSENAQTLTAALDELGNFLMNSQRSILAEQTPLTRESLMDVALPIPPARSIKDKSVSKIKDSSSVSDVRKLSYRNGDRKKTADIRSQNIVEVVRSGGSLGIREIAANLPEYSEKMIQRELLELVERGVIVKTGLKRWSKYSIPTQQ